MCVDRMHSQAIMDANKYGLPQTVIEHRGNFYNLASVMAINHYYRKTHKEGAPKLIVTWLPDNFFKN